MNLEVHSSFELLFTALIEPNSALFLQYIVKLVSEAKEIIRDIHHALTEQKEILAFSAQRHEEVMYLLLLLMSGSGFICSLMGLCDPVTYTLNASNLYFIMIEITGINSP